MSSVKELLRGDVVDGSGTANYVSKWSDADTITNSVIYDDGTNVGIGTSSPATSLDIAANNNGGTALNILRFTDTDITASPNQESGRIEFYTSDGSSAGVASYISGVTGTGADGRLIFATGFGGASAERMRIDSSGNVGIGTSSPRTIFNVEDTTGEHLINEFGHILTRNKNYAQANEFWAISPRNSGVLDIALGTVDAISSVSSANAFMTIDTSGNIGAPTGSNIYSASDERLKQNITPIESGLDTVSNLNPVKFNWIEGFSESEQGKDMLGFIAQEVQQVLPEAVEGFGGKDLTIGDQIIESPLRVNEKFIIPVLAKAIQELRAEVESLKSQINV